MPEKPVVIPYNNLVVSLRKHFKLKPSVAAERSKFRSRLQIEGKKLREFIS